MRKLYTAAQIVSYPNEQLSVHWLISETTGRSSLGFKRRNRTPHHTLEYRILGEIFETLIPNFESGEVKWNNQSYIEITDEINDALWERSVFICTIENDDFVKMQRMLISNWIPNNPIYSLIGNGIIPSSTANLFVSNVIAYLTSLPNTERNAIIAPTYKVYRLTYLGSSTVDYELEKEKITAYYNTLRMAMIFATSGTPNDRVERIIQNINAYDGDVYFYGYHQPGIYGYWRFVGLKIQTSYEPIRLSTQLTRSKTETVDSEEISEVSNSSVVTTNDIILLSDTGTTTTSDIATTTTSSSIGLILAAVLIIIIIIIIVFVLVYLASSTPETAVRIDPIQGIG